MHNIGTAFLEGGEDDKAREYFSKVLAIDPSHVPALLSMGATYQKQYEYSKARDFYLPIVSPTADTPSHATLENQIKALINIGRTYILQSRFITAGHYFSLARDLDPGNHVHSVNVWISRRLYAYFESHEKLIEYIVHGCQGGDVEGGADPSSLSAACNVSPWDSSLLPFDSTLQHRVIRASSFWMRGLMRYQYRVSAHSVPPLTKLNIGYVSFDFRDHAVCYLMQGIFHLFDRKGTNVESFAYGYSDFQMKSNCARSVMRTSSMYHDVYARDAYSSAGLIRERNIHILVDLMGHTENVRSEISALKPAPIIVNYLGFAATMGVDYVDYIIGDRTVFSVESAIQESYTESLVVLPHSFIPTFFQLTDSFCGRDVSCKGELRRSLHLPLHDFIFCNFAQPSKLEPNVIHSWLRILQRVPNSVIMLRRPYSVDSSTEGESNLIREAAAVGIDSSRILFFSPESREVYNKRLQAADMLLDTFIYGSHSTGLDALWQGVPILALKGQTFARKVAASFLTNLGIQELIAHTMKEYENIAVHLAMTPLVYRSIVRKLSFNLLHFPLFCGSCLTKSIDASYRLMWDAYSFTHENGQGVGGGSGSGSEGKLPHLVVHPRSPFNVPTEAYIDYLQLLIERAKRATPNGNSALPPDAQRRVLQSAEM
jgi:protein O-GlcNAc transferase